MPKLDCRFLLLLGKADEDMTGPEEAVLSSQFIEASRTNLSGMVLWPKGFVGPLNDMNPTNSSPIFAEPSCKIKLQEKQNFLLEIYSDKRKRETRIRSKTYTWVVNERMKWT